MATIEDKTVNKPTDGNGYELHDGDRVFTIEKGKRVYGTLTKETEHQNKFDWYVKWDDGEENVVLDFTEIWRADKA